MTEAVYEAGSWIYKMIFTLIIGSIAIAIIGLVVSFNMNTNKLQGDLILNKILYDPAGIWYVDEHGVFHPAVLDKSKFNQDHVNRIFDYPKNYGGARLTLIDARVSAGSALRSAIQSAPQGNVIYVGEETFNLIEVGFNSNIKGSGSVSSYVFPITVREGNTVREALLLIQIAIPARA